MALNKVIIMGRITHDLEMKQTPNGVDVLSFTVALDRYSKNTEEKQTDFISCVAWRQTAEFIYKYFGKGRMIAVTGNLHSRTYDDKNGTKHYVTEVYVDGADFTGEPKAAQSEQNAPQATQSPQRYNNTTQAPNAPQRAAQNATGAYDSQSTSQSSNFSKEFEGFTVFNDDGVPF